MAAKGGEHITYDNDFILIGQSKQCARMREPRGVLKIKRYGQRLKTHPKGKFLNTRPRNGVYRIHTRGWQKLTKMKLQQVDKGSNAWCNITHNLRHLSTFVSTSSLYYATVPPNKSTI